MQNHLRTELVLQALNMALEQRRPAEVIHHAHGVPVVTALDTEHAPEIANVYNEVNGLLYKGGFEELSLMLRRFVEESELSTRLGTNALRYYLEERSMAKMVERMLQAIRFVAAGHLPRESIIEPVRDA